jgi:hypothetical protein
MGSKVTRASSLLVLSCLIRPTSSTRFEFWRSRFYAAQRISWLSNRPQVVAPPFAAEKHPLPKIPLNKNVTPGAVTRTVFDFKKWTVGAPHVGFTCGVLDLRFHGSAPLCLSRALFVPVCGKGGCFHFCCSRGRWVAHPSPSRVRILSRHNFICSQAPILPLRRFCRCLCLSFWFRSAAIRGANE